MTWLKKFGSLMLKIGEAVIGFQPMISALADGSGNATLQVVSKDLAQIATAITEVEAMGQALSLPGAQKLTAAAPLVSQIVLQSSVMAGKKIADPAKFQLACTEIAGGVADLLNSLKDDVPSTSLT